MNKSLLTFISLLIFFTSCSSDDEILNQEKTNGFFVNSKFFDINKAYYINDITTEQDNDFIIIVTDGEIKSFSSNTKEFEFSETTTNAVIFRGIQNSENATALNFVPNGTYKLNSNNESLSFTNFFFNCTTTDQNLVDCQYMELIKETNSPNIATIDIERDDLTEIYNLKYSFELSNSKVINGNYSGSLTRFEH